MSIKKDLIKMDRSMNQLYREILEECSREELIEILVEVG